MFLKETVSYHAYIIKKYNSCFSLTIQKETLTVREALIIPQHIEQP